MDSSLVSTKKYIVYFSLIYAGIMIVTNILLNVFDIDAGAAMNFVMLIAAAYGAAARFVMDNKRVPAQQEKNLLVWGCLIASIIISFVDMVVVILIVSGTAGFAEMSELMSTLPVKWWLLIMVIVTAIEYFLLSLVFGWGAGKFAEKLQQQSAD